MDFQAADRRYAELQWQRNSGTLDQEEFEAELEKLMVKDQQGRWWSKSKRTGEWHYFNGSTWMPGTPVDHDSRNGHSVNINEESRATRGWNWGAFVFNWIWAIFNLTGSQLVLTLVFEFLLGWLILPAVAWSIVLGAKGNEWSWHGRRWESVAQFQRSQRRWSLAGLIYLGLMLFLIVVFVVLWLTTLQTA